MPDTDAPPLDLGERVVAVPPRADVSCRGDEESSFVIEAERFLREVRDSRERAYRDLIDRHGLHQPVGAAG